MSATLSHYAFTITLDGGCYFRTDPDWGHFLNIEQANTAFDMFEKRFPKEEGFRVVMTYWDSTGREIRATTPTA